MLLLETVFEDEAEEEPYASRGSSANSERGLSSIVRMNSVGPEGRGRLEVLALDDGALVEGVGNVIVGEILRNVLNPTCGRCGQCEEIFDGIHQNASRTSGPYCPIR